MIEYYKNLLIMQYRNQPKALATIDFMVSLILQDEILLQVLNGFNPETAVGKQLDILGKWIGIDRYYSDGQLNDSDYKTILEFKSISNAIDMSPSSIDNILYEFFQDNIICSSEDNLRIYYFAEPDVFNLATIMLEKNVFPKPIGIQLGGIILNQIYFGFCDSSTFNNAIAGNVTGFANSNNFLTKEGRMLTSSDIIN